jgi:chaperone modulatory protein CbpM
VKIDLTELVWLDESTECTLVELAERSRLSEAEIVELVDYGVLPSGDRSTPQARFPPRALATARTAARLRDDFEIDLPGVALALTLLQRIEELERRLNQATLYRP